MPRFENGYIKWHRKAFFGDIGQNINCLGIWVALLSLANWKESKIIWKGAQRTLAPGVCVIGLRDLAEKLRCSKDTIARWLKYLERSGRIETEHSTLGTVVTIRNWDLYQSDTESSATALETQIGHDAGRSLGQRPTLIEEVKKERKKKSVVGAIFEFRDSPVLLEMLGGVSEELQRGWVSQFPDQTNWLKNELKKAAIYAKAKAEAGKPYTKLGLFFTGWLNRANPPAPALRSRPVLDFSDDSPADPNGGLL